MAINKYMRYALKLLSYPDIDIKKIYPIDRSLRFVKSQPLLMPFYKRNDHLIQLADREVLTRVYEPSEVESNDLVLFFHGGGWVTESIDTYNSVCRALSKALRRRVISVEYRLAPENPFPDGLDDCYQAAKEVILNKQNFDFPIEQVILMGDSAGGNLAAAVSLLARDRGEFAVERQILLYPATFNFHDERSPFPSIVENGTDYLLTSKRICDYIDLYKSKDEDYYNPYFAPLLHKDLTHQPQTLVITAEYDPLRDEGEEYAKKLRLAGNVVSGYRMADALHGFLSLGVGYVHVRRAHKLFYKFIIGSEKNAAEKGLDEA